MRRYFSTIFLLLLFGCESDKLELSKYGEISFRNTLNLLREVTDAEMDSLKKCRPTYRGPEKGNQLFDLLIKKGIASGLELDTSTLNLTAISTEAPFIHISGLDFNLETINHTGHQYLHIKKAKEKFKIDLGPDLLGKKWLSLLDIDGLKGLELLVLEKYYVMGGDNYDLEFYSFE